MVRWRYLFTQSMIQRGMAYYQQKRVRNLTYARGTYTALVRGNHTYRVYITVTENTMTEMSCSCPYASSGNHCKHMAAVLLAVENGETEPQKTRGEVHPFTSDDTEDSAAYRYFDIGRMTENMVFYEDTYQKALEMVQQGEIENFRVEFGYPEDDYNDFGREMTGDAIGFFHQFGYRQTVRMLFNRTQILRSSCDVRVNGFDYSGTRWVRNRLEPNIYMMALLLLIARELAQNNAVDSTDRNAMKLLGGFRSSSTVLPRDSREIHLEPRLIRQDGELSLSLRAGTDKLYVLKNITGFVETAEERKEWNMGKATIVFARDYICPADMPLYQFVKGIVYDANYRAENTPTGYYGRSRVSNESLKSAIPLYGSRLDQFYRLCANGDSVAFIDKDADTGAEKLRMGSLTPKITLDVRKHMDENGVFHGITAEGSAPVILEGADCRYFIEGGCLNRIPPEADQRLRALYGLVEGDGTLSFRIGRNNLTEFYYSVLPTLREMAEVHEYDSDVVEQYLPSEVTFVFYLDCAESILSCRAEACYGERTFAVTDGSETRNAGESFRDLYREAGVLAAVKEFFPETDRENGLFLCPKDDDSVYRVLTGGVAALMKWGEVQGTSRFSSLRVRSRINVKVGVSVESSLMDLDISSTDVTQQELLDILKSYRLKKRYHRLKNGDFVNIDESIEELGAMVEAMRLSNSDFLAGKMKLPAYRALYIDKMAEKCGALRFQRDRCFKKIAQEFKTVSESDFEVPERLQGIMRNYQCYGHKWLRTLEKYGFGGILADDMGLGKTLQVISVFAAAKAEGQTMPSLVICPSSLVYNWQEELRRFAPELSCTVVAGTQKERQTLIASSDGCDVMITSYDLLKRDVALYENTAFYYQILDEAQYIKTHTTAAAKAVKIINSRVRFALTGTPIENRLSELWSIFDYLMPGFLYGYEVFRKDFETPIAKKGDEQVTEKLKRMAAPFILRRLKADVLKDLPEKIEEVRYAAFDGEQQHLYDAQVAHMKELLESQDEQGLRQNKLAILAELTRIRQICCDPSLLFENYKGESAKRETCMELVRSAIEGEHRILLFSQFTSMLALLENDLQQAQIDYYKIIGSTPKAERVELVKRFNEGNVPVFLISLKSGGTGLNLTGADVVIHYDPWWNMAAQNQATDRAHRIGQTKIVSVYRLIVRHSVEEKILALQESKKNLADEILTGEMGNIGSLSKEDLLALVQ